MPASQNETMLRYYYIDTDNQDKYGNYTWTLVGGTVDKNKDTLTGGITKMGVYCAISSKSHTANGSTSTGTTVTSKNRLQRYGRTLG